MTSQTNLLPPIRGNLTTYGGEASQGSPTRPLALLKQSSSITILPINQKLVQDRPYDSIVSNSTQHYHKRSQSQIKLQANINAAKLDQQPYVAAATSLLHQNQSSEYIDSHHQTSSLQQFGAVRSMRSTSFDNTYKKGQVMPGNYTLLRQLPSQSVLNSPQKQSGREQTKRSAANQYASTSAMITLEAQQKLQNEAYETYDHSERFNFSRKTRPQVQSDYFNNSQTVSKPFNAKSQRMPADLRQQRVQMTTHKNKSQSLRGQPLESQHVPQGGNPGSRQSLLQGVQFDSESYAFQAPHNEQIQKILSKRIKRASPQMSADELTQQYYHNRSKETSPQKPTLLGIRSMVSGTSIPITAQQAEENLLNSSDDDGNSEKERIQKKMDMKELLALNLRKKIKKDLKQQKELKDFVESQKQQLKPKLTKIQAKEKIAQFELATEKRAQERLDRLQNPDYHDTQAEFQKKLLSTGISLSALIPDLLAQDSSESETNSELSGVRVTDNKNKKFRYKLPTQNEVIDDVSNKSLQSFYSKQVKVEPHPQKVKYIQNKLQETLLARVDRAMSHRKEAIEEGSNEDQDDQTMTVCAVPQKPEDQVVEDIEILVLAEAEAEMMGEKLADQQKQEKEQLKREREEQLELCGEEFLDAIHEMIQSFDIPVVRADSTTGGDQLQLPLNNGNQFKTGNFSEMRSSVRSIREKQVLDTFIPRQLLRDFESMLKKQAAFFKKAKSLDRPIYQQQTDYDDKLSYFNECLKNKILCFPFLNRVQNHTLVLQNQIMKEGLCKAIKSVLSLVPTLLTSIALSQNGFQGDALPNILQGLLMQQGFKSLSLQDNELDEKSIDLISKMCQRKIPEQLDQLNLYYCKVSSNLMEKLIKSLQKSQLRTLSLVKVPLNDFSMPAFEQMLLLTQRRLTSLDISWCSLRPKQMKRILMVLSEMRKLQYINLSWNNICDTKYTEKEQMELVGLLGKQIKHNRQLLHLDLTSTGLSTLVIKEMGTCLRRARSLLSIHLSGNPGLTKENQEQLVQRLKCRPNEDIERFARIQSVIYEYMQELPGQLKQGIVRKMNQIIEFQKRDTEPHDKLVLQRQLSFKDEQPGSAQWYEASHTAVPYKKHYKNDWWVCEKHVYSVLLWSRGKAYILSPILPERETERIRIQIDLVSVEDYEKGQMDPGLGFVNGNLPYSGLEDKVPYITGSFTGWRYKKMIPLHEFTQSIDKGYRDPLKVAYFDNKIKREVSSIKELTDVEMGHYKVVCSNERKKYRTQWARYFKEFLTYKRPYLINAEPFNNIDDELDAVTAYPYGVASAAKIEKTENSSQNSDDQGQDEENDEMTTIRVVAEQKQTIQSTQETPKNDQPDPSQQRTQYSSFRREEKPKPEPIPTPPDESKWDIIYCLPFFAKPGRHTYLIKYKNTQEKHQKKLLKKKFQLEQSLPVVKGISLSTAQQQLKSVNEDLKPECFLYSMQVIHRTEPIPVICKEQVRKEVQRQFHKETSVFKQWKEETLKKKQQSIRSDAELWKLHKFMNKPGDDIEIQKCTDLFLKHQDFLKECFLSMISVSSYPAITLNDLTAFVQRCGMLDSNLTMSTVDRLFISSNYNLPGNPEFQIIGNALVRFELWELFVRIAVEKFKNPGVVLTYSEAVEKLFVEHILPNAKPEPWQTFRDKELWTLEVNDILEANLKQLKKIYDSKILPIKKHLTLEDIYVIFNKDALMEIPEPEMKYCFALSKMSVTSEAANYKQYNVMLFPEWLEFIGRMGDIKFRDTDESDQPLAWKIEQVLEELCPQFGLKKNDVNINQEDLSESDDEY